jgi:nucleoid-associated protein YgaU
MQVGQSSREPSSRRRRIALFVLLGVFFCSGYAHAQSAQDQDVAEAARQERVRKGAQQSDAPHVYSNDDLKKDKILVPADQARVEARKKLKKETAAQQNADARPAVAPPTDQPAQETQSLGEIARRYRAEKAAREAAEAQAKRFAPLPYTTPKANETLAAPTPEVAPLVENRSASKSPVSKNNRVFSAAPPSSANGGSGHRARISPFQPRPLPARPSLPLPVVPLAPSRKVTAVPTERVAPVQPKMPVAPVEPKTTRKVESPIANIAPPVGMAEMRTLQVQRGDNWWKLARRYLGSGARWPELRKMNPAGNEPSELLKQGNFVVVPGTVPARTLLSRRVTVKKGDTFWSLAHEHLGRGSAWGCLAGANPEISDYTRLAIGTSLLLPSAEVLKTCKPFTARQN